METTISGNVKGWTERAAPLVDLASRAEFPVGDRCIGRWAHVYLPYSCIHTHVCIPMYTYTHVYLYIDIYIYIYARMHPAAKQVLMPL